MKCLKINGPKKLIVADMTNPPLEGSDIVIEVLKAGICGSDLHYYNDGKPQNLILGHEFCGKVIYPGYRNDLNVDDLVTALPINPCGECDNCKSGNIHLCKNTWVDAVGLSNTYPGAFAEQLKVKSNMVIKIPQNVSIEEATMIEPTAVSIHALNVGDINVGDNVLIIGAGVIGALCGLLAIKQGAKYVAIADVNEARCNKVKSLDCCHEIFNPSNKDYYEKVLANNPNGFDKIIDCCGNSNAVNNAIDLIKPNGTIVLVGVSNEPISIPTLKIVTKDIQIKGSIAYTYEEFMDSLGLMKSKAINVIPFISDEVSLKDANKAFKELTSKNNDKLKIFIDPQKK